MHRNRKSRPVVVLPPQPPRNRRLAGWERRLGVRRRELPGIFTEFTFEVVFPLVTFVLLSILAFLTFFL
jgi:hypothetical protein